LPVAVVEKEFVAAHVLLPIITLVEAALWLM
jgi:hypothetical protein